MTRFTHQTRQRVCVCLFVCVVWFVFVFIICSFSVVSKILPLSGSHPNDVLYMLPYGFSRNCMPARIKSRDIQRSQRIDIRRRQKSSMARLVEGNMSTCVWSAEKECWVWLRSFTNRNRLIVAQKRTDSFNYQPDCEHIKLSQPNEISCREKNVTRGKRKYGKRTNATQDVKRPIPKKTERLALRIKKRQLNCFFGCAPGMSWTHETLAAKLVFPWNGFNSKPVVFGTIHTMSNDSMCGKAPTTTRPPKKSTRHTRKLFLSRNVSTVVQSDSAGTRCVLNC